MNKIYVGNLRWEITDQQLGEFFTQAGEVVSASVILDRQTGRSKGFGFVEMKDGIEEALMLHGRDFNGRTLTVREAKPEAGREFNEVGNKIKDFCLSCQVEQEMKFKVGEKHFKLVRDL